MFYITGVTPPETIGKAGIKPMCSTLEADALPVGQRGAPWPEHHSTDRLTERGVEKKKRPTIRRPRSRTICVQPDRYWHCFEGNLGETSERWSGARMGLSERFFFFFLVR